MFDQEAPFDGGRMVKVDFGPFFGRFMPIVFVIGILGDDGHRIFGQAFYDLFDNG